MYNWLRRILTLTHASPLSSGPVHWLWIHPQYMTTIYGINSRYDTRIQPDPLILSNIARSQRKPSQNVLHRSQLDEISLDLSETLNFVRYEKCSNDDRAQLGAK